MSLRTNAAFALVMAIAALVAASMVALAWKAPAGAQPEGERFVLAADGNELPPDLEGKVEDAGGTVEEVISDIGAAVVRGEEAGFEERAEGIEGVRSVTEDIEIEWIDPKNESVAAGVGDPPASGEDDPFFDLQWGHDAVEAPQAWNTGEPGAFGEGVRVAILDSGIDADHPDIAPNLNEELSESFVEGEGYDIAPGEYFNHGTHVGGTVAAADNSVGTIGVAPEAELVAVKVLSEETGSGSFSGVAEGITYAADVDSDVINMSLGGTVPRGRTCDDEGNCVSGKESAELINLLKRAVQHANDEGTTVIASAGNSAIDRNGDRKNVVLPADLPGVVSISATGPEGWAIDPDTNLDTPAFYTNYGTSAIDLAAPGGDVDRELQKSGRECTVAGVTDECWRFDLVYSTVSEGWGWAAGTSMAAPHASGVAAIIIAQNGGDLAPSQVESELRAASDDLGKPGKDDYFGHGRVNAEEAVR